MHDLDATVTLDEWGDLRTRLDKLVAELNEIPGCHATLDIRVNVQVTVAKDV